MSSSRSTYLAIASGSAIGATARYVVTLAMHDGSGLAFPWATFGVNTSGSFLIGFLATLTLPGGRLRTTQVTRHFILVGVLGGFTTFSAFSLEFVSLMIEQRSGQAALYLLAGLLLWIPAAGLGHLLARGLDRRGPARSALAPPGGIRTEDPTD